MRDSGGYVEGFDTMLALRPAMDERLTAWSAQVRQDWLDQDLRWFSGATQQDTVRPRTLVVMHLFNHQTHHRGQAHAMITAAGEQTGATDLPFVLA